MPRNETKGIRRLRRHGKALAALLLLLAAGAPLPAASSSQLSLSQDGSRLAVANIDSDTLGIVDTGGRSLVKEIPVGRRPECAAFVGGTGKVLVTLYKDDALAVVDVAEGRVKVMIPVGDEPYGVVASRDGTRAWVSLDYPGTVVEVDLVAAKPKRSFQVGGFARGLALSADERRLFVTGYYTSLLSIIDLETGSVIERFEGESADNLSRHVVLHPSLPKAYLPHVRSRITNPHGEGSIFPLLTVVSLDAGAERKR